MNNLKDLLLEESNLKLISPPATKALEDIIQVMNKFDLHIKAIPLIKGYAFVRPFYNKEDGSINEFPFFCLVDTQRYSFHLFHNNENKTIDSNNNVINHFDVVTNKSYLLDRFEVFTKTLNKNNANDSINFYGGEFDVVEGRDASFLQDYETTNTLSSAIDWAEFHIQEIPKRLTGHISAHIWPFRRGNNEFLSFTLSDGIAEDDYSITFHCKDEHNNEQTEYDVMVPDMSEALHMAGLVTTALNVNLTLGQYKSEFNSSHSRLI